jgi:hypothetical protein
MKRRHIDFTASLALPALLRSFYGALPNRACSSTIACMAACRSRAPAKEPFCFLMHPSKRGPEAARLPRAASARHPERLCRGRRGRAARDGRPGRAAGACAPGPRPALCLVPAAGAAARRGRAARPPAGLVCAGARPLGVPRTAGSARLVEVLRLSDGKRLRQAHAWTACPRLLSSGTAVADNHACMNSAQTRHTLPKCLQQPLQKHAQACQG